jgi:UDP-N-acetylmuramate dehydrogenase
MSKPHSVFAAETGARAPVSAAETVVRGGDVDVAAGVLGPRSVRNEPLAPMTTYRVGGAAALFVRARSVDDLRAVATARAESGLPILVVGRGSNLLVADTGFHGIAVSIADVAGEIEIADGGPGCVVSAGGGVALPVLARRTAASGITGFEWAVGVPGSVGGAVRMNAGGHGSDMAACVFDVVVIDLAADHPEPVTVPVDALGLRFRGSDLSAEHVVLSARIGLRRGDRAAAEAEIAEIVRWRRENQPGGQNAGSVFVNPVPFEVSAGSLIDGLGLRGLRIGTAWVSEKHANFIQAAEEGRAADVVAVMGTVRQRVLAATGYRLRSEIRLIGFPDGDEAPE